MEPTLGWSDPEIASNLEDKIPEVSGYRLQRRLGRGGMGEVYLALQHGTSRPVALKMPRRDAGLRELTRFRAEAEALARLQHPGIVPVYEVGEAGSRLFLAMEFCPGGSLADRLDGTPLAPHIAATLVEALARAVHAAHRAGIVHRDLKPSNILLSPRPDGVEPSSDKLETWAPRISDFGLARLMDDDRGLTQTGTVLGTPTYMAPEQAFGDVRQVGWAADVYSLGVILYELLTGRPPFKGATTLDTLDQLRSQDPVPPCRLQPRIPRDLETICMKCLFKDSSRRYPTADALAEDIRCFLENRPILARPVGSGERLSKWVRRNPRVAVLSSLLALALLTVFVVGGIYQVRLARQRDRALHHLKVALHSVDGLLTEVEEEVSEPLPEAKRRALLEKALALNNELVRVEGDDFALREQTAIATRRVGDIQRQLGRYPESQAAYSRALQQFEALTTERPDRSDLRRHTADCHNFTGEVLRLTARPNEAAAEYRKARDIQKAIATVEPENTAIRCELARSHYNLGIVERDANRLAEAREEYEEAVGLLRAMDLDTFDRQWHLARSLINLGAVLRLLNEPARANVAYSEAMNLYETLTRELPKRAQFWQELAKLLINRANLRNRGEDSSALLLRSLNILKRLATDYPETPEYQSDLALACNTLASSAFERHELAEAERWLGESAVTWRKMLVTHSTVPNYHAGLGMALGNLGRVRLTRADVAKTACALASPALIVTLPASRDNAQETGSIIREGIRELTIALNVNPSEPECRGSLRSQCGDLARIGVLLGDETLVMDVAEELGKELRLHSVGPAYAAFMLGRFASLRSDPGTTRRSADRVLMLLADRPPEELEEQKKLLSDPALDPFRRHEQLSSLLPHRK